MDPMTFDDLLQAYGPVAPVIFALGWAYLKERQRSDAKDQKLWQMAMETKDALNDLAAAIRERKL